MIMGWRGSRSGASNPAYHSPAWRKIKKYWRTQRLPCARCQGMIDYDGTYLLPTGRVNPHYLAIGHHVSIAVAMSHGWTDDMINSIANTQPEHKRCSDVSGARSGNARQRATNKGVGTVKGASVVQAAASTRW